MYFIFKLSILTIMKKCLLFCVFLLSLSGIKSQKPAEKAEIKGLDIFVLGDAIAKYENKIIASPLKTPKPTGDRYKYTGKEITSYQGYKVTEILLEFCSGKLESVMYRFDNFDPRSNENFTRQQLDQVKNKLIKQIGNPRMHNNNSMGPDEKGRGGLTTESWAWNSDKKLISLIWMKTGFSNKEFASISVLDQTLRKECSGK